MRVERFSSGFSFCLACGLGGFVDRERCVECGNDNVIVAAELLPQSDLKIGGVRRSSQRQDVAIDHDDGFYFVVSENGTFARIEQKDFVVEGSVLVDRSLGSRAAAVLVVLRSRMPSSNANFSVYRDAVSALCGGDVGRLRRCAVEIVELGRAELLDALALAESERRWWAAMTHVLAGRHERAIQDLSALPAGRYPDAAGLLYRCRIQGDAEAPRNAVASTVLKERFGTADAVSGTALASLDAAEMDRYHWVFEDSTDFSGTPIGTEGHEFRDLALIVDGERAGPFRYRVPDELPLSIVDTLIDNGAKIDVAAVNGRPESETMYLRARLQPEVLDEQQLRELDFTDELVRRRLAQGELVDVDTSEVKMAEIVDRIVFVTTGQLTDSFRTELGDLAEPLERFVQDPRPENLSEPIASDASLWPYLAERLSRARIELEPPRGSATAEFVAWFSLQLAFDRLYEADWSAALGLARDVLKRSDREVLRDEALNVIACAHWQLGNDQEACKALESALEGARNEALQVNLGVVASDSSPELAALELARLVNEGTTLELRCQAALRATSIWLNDEMPWESENDEGMPSSIRAALRSIVVEPIPLDSFRSILALQANLDSEWLASQEGLAGSPHKESVEARLYRAKATGPVEEIEVMTEVLCAPDPPQWVRDERDQFIGAVTRHAFDDLSSNVALFALAAIENGLPVEPEQRDVIAPLAVIAACQQIDPAEGEPADKFFELLVAGERSVASRGEGESLGKLYQTAWSHLVLSRVMHAAHICDLLVDNYNAFISHNATIPRWRLDMRKVREAFAPMQAMLVEVLRGLDHVAHFTVSEEIANLRSEVTQNAQELQSRIQEVIQ